MKVLVSLPFSRTRHDESTVSMYAHIYCTFPGANSRVLATGGASANKAILQVCAFQPFVSDAKRFLSNTLSGIKVGLGVLFHHRQKRLLHCKKNSKQ